MLWAWGSILIRSGLILGAAELLRRCSSKLAPRDRHRIILAAFLLLLLWPLLSALLPEIPVPLHISGASDGTVTVEQTITGLKGHLQHSSTGDWILTIWLAGVVVALVPIVLSHFNVHRLSRRAYSLQSETWEQALAEECSRLGLRRQPILLLYPGRIVPFTFSLRHPRILLPEDWRRWTPIRQRAVLVHELAHIKRRDLLWQFLANLTSAFWWMQPLCWWNRWNLRRESERASDALVVQSGILPSDYARELLEIAQSFAGSKEWSTGAIAMVRRGELEGRLYAILGQPTTGVRRLPLAPLAALTLLTVAASALTIFPEPSLYPGGYNMKHTLMAGLLVSAGLSATALGGPISDPNAAANAHNPVPFHNGVPGQNVATKDNHATETQQAPPKTIRVGGNVAQNNLMYKVQPVYPASAKAAHIQGTVDLKVTISNEGVPEDLQVVSSPSDDLTQSAMDAVRQWRYRPTLLNGNPVAVVTDVMVNYTLSK